MDGGEAVQFAVRRESFGEKERDAARYDALRASIFRFDTGVEAIRLANARGHVVALPFMGQMVWSAAFDGVELAMQSMFRAPRPAKTIVETYGCLAYHAGLLRNGVPGDGDTHAVHGEAPCADMDEAGIACGSDARGPWMAVTGARDYAIGFGAHYRATPRVVASRRRRGVRDRYGGGEPLGGADGPYVLVPRQFRFRRGGAHCAACSFHARSMSSLERRSPATSFRPRNIAS